MIMKKIFLTLALTAGIMAAGQVKMGDNPTVIGASSILEIESTSKALVVTRVATTSAISNPVNGMIVYVLSENKFRVYVNNKWFILFY
jgi:trimeric autotransporter adhesin